MDDDSNSNRSENEEDKMSDVNPDNTDLKFYFLENWNFSGFYKRLAQDMDKICANDRFFFGLCGVLVKLYKINNVLK